MTPPRPRPGQRRSGRTPLPVAEAELPSPGRPTPRASRLRSARRRLRGAATAQPRDVAHRSGPRGAPQLPSADEEEPALEGRRNLRERGTMRRAKVCRVLPSDPGEDESPPGPEHARDLARVLLSAAYRQSVKAAVVRQPREPRTRIREGKDIANPELRREAPATRPVPGRRDRSWGEIDPVSLKALLGEIQDVGACPASKVEHRAPRREESLLDRLDDLRARARVEPRQLVVRGPFVGRLPPCSKRC